MHKEVGAFLGRFVWRGIHPSRGSRINPTL